MRPTVRFISCTFCSDGVEGVLFPQFLYSLTPHCDPGLAADGTGEQGQVPVSGLHLLHSGSGKLFQFGHLVGEQIAICVREQDFVPHIQFTQAGEMPLVVVPCDNQVIQIGGTGVPAGCQLQGLVAPLADDGQRQL